MIPRKDWHFERTQTRARRLTTKECSEFRELSRALFQSSYVPFSAPNSIVLPTCCRVMVLSSGSVIQKPFILGLCVFLYDRECARSRQQHKCITWYIRCCLSRACVCGRNPARVFSCAKDSGSRIERRALYQALRSMFALAAAASHRPFSLLEATFNLALKNDREVIYLRTSLYAVSWKFQKKSCRQ